MHKALDGKFNFSAKSNMLPINITASIFIKEGMNYDKAGKIS